MKVFLTLINIFSIFNIGCAFALLMEGLYIKPSITQLVLAIMVLVASTLLKTTVNEKEVNA